MGAVKYDELEMTREELTALNTFEGKDEQKKPSFSAYRLLEEIVPGIRYFGKVKTFKKKSTAEFICICDEAFRSELGPILSGRKKDCGCGASAK